MRTFRPRSFARMAASPSRWAELSRPGERRHEPGFCPGVCVGTSSAQARMACRVVQPWSVRRPRVTIVMGLDQHRAQVTADWLNTETGEVGRARVTPAHRDGVRRFLGRFAGQDLEVALEATTGWRFVVEELHALVIDERSNTIMLRDLQKSIEDVSTLVAKLDLRTAQVLIESNLVETTPTFSRALGTEIDAEYLMGGLSLVQDSWPVVPLPEAPTRLPRPFRYRARVSGLVTRRLT